MVAAVSVPFGMPSRQFSAAILGGSWPYTDPGGWQQSAEGQHGKGVQLLGNAEQLRNQAQGVAAEQSGRTIDGFSDWYSRTAAECTQQADDAFFPMSRASDGVAGLLGGLRTDLDDIDRQAHQQIEQLQSMGFTATMIGQQTMAIVAAARAQATAKATEAAAAIAQRGKDIGIDVPNTWSQTNPDTDNPADRSHNAVQPAGWGTPPPKAPPKPPPPAAPAPGDPPPGRGLTEQPGSSHIAPDGGDAPGPGVLGNQFGADPSTGGKPKGPVPQAPSTSSMGGAPLGGNPGIPGGLGGGGMPGGLGGGGMPGGLGGGGMPGGLSGGGLPAQGLGSGAGVPSAPASVSPAAGMPADFSRGLGSGLGAGGAPAPLAPPVSSPPPSTPPPTGLSSAPAGAVGGPAAVSAMSSTPTAASAPVTGSAGVAAAPMGALPPFGSDVPRAAAASAAASAPVSQAGGGTPTPVTASGGAGSPGGGVAPLPPGVVGSGVGASAGAASEGIRSSLPDPLLAAASQLVYQLLHDSRLYPYMDWCVGVFRTPSGVETVIVNGDGAGYLPVGVFVPRSARMLFADAGLSPQFRGRWFSWANPAETMLAYAELAADNDPNIELWALAVSTDHGGSSVPARGVVPHFEDCARALSSIPDTAAASALDDSHMHRLETLDRALYARLTGFGDGRLPDQSEAWRTTAAAAHLALGRAGGAREVAVAPVIRDVIDLLAKGLAVPGDSWQALEAAHIDAVMYSASLRPGRMYNDAPAAAPVLAYHDLARLTELLSLWHHDSIKYPEIAYLARQIQLTPQPSGTG